MGTIRSEDLNSPTFLVMSRDDDRRTSWTQYLATAGSRTISCSGPEVNACALSINNRCALLEAADVIFYDQDSVTPDLERQLRQRPPASPIVFARSEPGPDGRAFPVATRFTLQLLPFDRTPRALGPAQEMTFATLTVGPRPQAGRMPNDVAQLLIALVAIVLLAVLGALSARLFMSASRARPRLTSAAPADLR